MGKQTKSKKKLKHKHFSPIIFVKLVSPAGKKGRQSKTRLVKALVDSGASESILAKSKSEKLPDKKTKIIGLKCLCFSFFLDLVCLTILDVLRRVFNM